MIVTILHPFILNLRFGISRNLFQASVLLICLNIIIYLLRFRVNGHSMHVAL